MRFVFLSLFFLNVFHVNKACSQSITPFTLNNGGGYSSSMEWNMGDSESIVNFITPSYFLNTGVLSPIPSIVTLINDNGLKIFGTQITVGPNPTTDIVHFKSLFNEIGTLSIQILNSKSSLVFSHETGIIYNSFEKDIHLENYAPGIFYLKVFFKPMNAPVKTGVYKIIKL